MFRVISTYCHFPLLFFFDAWGTYYHTAIVHSDLV